MVTISKSRVALYALTIGRRRTAVRLHLTAALVAATFAFATPLAHQPIRLARSSAACSVNVPRSRLRRHLIRQPQSSRMLMRLRRVSRVEVVSHARRWLIMATTHQGPRSSAPRSATST